MYHRNDAELLKDTCRIVKLSEQQKKVQKKVYQLAYNEICFSKILFVEENGKD